MAKHRTRSRTTRLALRTMAAAIRERRLARRMTQAELAERIGVARSTYQLIERGHPGVEIGSVFEAAVVLGVDLFELRTDAGRSRADALFARLALLPARGVSDAAIDDEF